MSDTDVGTVSVSIALKFDELITGIALATTAFTEMGAAMEAQAAEAQAAVESRFLGMASVMGALVAAIGGVIEIGSQMETMFLNLQANTGSTDAQMGEMTAQIKQLGEESGANLQQVTDGMMHVRNMAFEGAGAMKVLQAATEAAVATGGNVSDTANLLAQVMHVYKINADDAMDTMNLLLVASQKGNMTLQEFMSASGQMMGVAANLGVSLKDAAAAMSTLTENGMRANVAATQLMGLFKQITEPSKKVEDYIASLGTAGQRLAADFSFAGLHARGFNGVLADVQRVSEETGIKFDELVGHLFVGARGGRAALELLGSGADDLKQRQLDLADVIEHKVTPVQDDYEKKLNSLGTQMGRLKNASIEAAAGVFSAWEPVLSKLIGLTADFTGALARLGGGARGPDAHVTPEELGRRAGLEGWFGPTEATRARDRQNAIQAQLARVAASLRSQIPGSLSEIFGGQRGGNRSIEDVLAETMPGVFVGQRAKPDHTPGLTEAQQAFNDAKMAQYEWNKAFKDGFAEEKKGRAEAARAAKDASQNLAELNKNINDLAKRAFAATHTPEQVAVREAQIQRQEDLSTAAGNPKARLDALTVYRKAVKDAHDEALQQVQKQMTEWRKVYDELAKREQAVDDERRKRLDATNKFNAEMADMQSKAMAQVMDQFDKDEAEAVKRNWAGIDETIRKTIKAAIDSANTSLNNLLEGGRHLMQSLAGSAVDLDNQERARQVASLQNYKAILEQKQAAVRRFSDEWLKLEQQIQGIQDRIERIDIHPWEQVLNQMEASAKSILIDKLGSALTSGFKGFFTQILQSFEQMLAQMAAQALVSGIFGLLGGGGGGFFGSLLGGLLGGGGGGGGGDPMFGGRAVAAGGAAPLRGITLNVNMHGGQTFANSQDVRSVADAISWHVQSRLSVVRAPKL